MSQLIMAVVIVMFRDWCFSLLLSWIWTSAGDYLAMHAHSRLGEFSYDERDSMSSEYNFLPSFWSLIFSNTELQRLGRAAYCL